MKTLFLFPVLILSYSLTALTAQQQTQGSELDGITVETYICDGGQYIWMATNKGLLRRNLRTGKEWLITVQGTIIPSVTIMCGISLTDGRTYIGTTKGILYWDNFALILISSENSHLPENYITALILDDHNDLWIGTYSHGVVKGIGDPIKPFKTRSIKTRDLEITAITMDKSGLICVAYRNGGYEYFRDGVSIAYSPGLAMN